LALAHLAPTRVDPGGLDLGIGVRKGTSRLLASNPSGLGRRFPTEAGAKSGPGFVATVLFDRNGREDGPPVPGRSLPPRVRT
jgi:hypothetical protein